MYHVQELKLYASVGDPRHFGADPEESCKKKILFFPCNLPEATLSAKILGKIKYFENYFRPLNIFLRKGNDPDLDPYL
jgi:hypothetical protein